MAGRLLTHLSMLVHISCAMLWPSALVPHGVCSRPPSPRVVLCGPRARPLTACGRAPIEKKKLFQSFTEAREMARAMGLSSKAEWDDYSCPGAYRLPKEPDAAWPDEWRGWEDWLGVPRPYGEASEQAKRLGVVTQAEYERLAAAEPDARLPARPDLYYRGTWEGWDEFLRGGG
eukprot:scaffold7752_cov101-Isochrysis_galbana.AAC.4